MTPNIKLKNENGTEFECGLCVNLSTYVKSNLFMAGDIVSSEDPKCYISFGRISGQSNAGTWIYGTMASLFANTIQLGNSGNNADGTPKSVINSFGTFNQHGPMTINGNLKVTNDTTFLIGEQTLAAYIDSVVDDGTGKGASKSWVRNNFYNKSEVNAEITALKKWVSENYAANGSFASSGHTHYFSDSDSVNITVDLPDGTTTSGSDTVSISGHTSGPQ